MRYKYSSYVVFNGVIQFKKNGNFIPSDMIFAPVNPNNGSIIMPDHNSDFTPISEYDFVTSLVSNEVIVMYNCD